MMGLSAISALCLHPLPMLDAGDDIREQVGGYSEPQLKVM